MFADDRFARSVLAYHVWIASILFDHFADTKSKFTSIMEQYLQAGKLTINMGINILRFHA